MRLNASLVGASSMNPKCSLYPSPRSDSQGRGSNTSQMTQLSPPYSLSFSPSTITWPRFQRRPVIRSAITPVHTVLQRGLTFRSTGQCPAVCFYSLRLGLRRRPLPVTSDVRPLKLRVASYSKLVRSPFSVSTNEPSAVASFPQIVGARAGASRSDYVHVNHLGFKSGSCRSFHQPSCVK